MKHLITYLTFSLVFALAGCAGLTNRLALKAGYQEVSKVEQQITSLKETHQAEIAAKTVEVERRYDGLLAQVKKNFQESSNFIYGASLASDLKENKTRLDTILDYRIKTALSFGMPPTPEAMQLQLSTLREELDETKVSAAELAKRYNEKQEEAAKAQRDLVTKDNQLNAAKEERERLNDDYQVALLALGEELSKAQNSVISLEQERANNAESIRAAKMKMSMVLGALALASLAGAVWSPVWKDKFGLFAGLLGLCSLGIWYIQAWMLGVGAGVIVLGIIAWIARQYYHTDKDATNTYRAIQRVKDSNPDEYVKVLKPQLSEYHQNYENGAKVPDVAAAARIDRVLERVGDR